MMSPGSRYSTLCCRMPLQRQPRASFKGKHPFSFRHNPNTFVYGQRMSLKPSLSARNLRPTFAPLQCTSVPSRYRPLLKPTAFRTNPTTSSTSPTPIKHTSRPFSTTPSSGMSFSNADTGNKPADPYKAKNIDEPQLKENIEDLVSFIEACKFGMMTTRIASSGLLVSRCMALAGKVSLHIRLNLCPSYLP